MKKTIKIFLCCHNKYGIVPPLCIPIQCGSAINPHIEGCINDSIGDNISHKNPEYCELTAHYYAWRNEEADYYGFCHYRRFFAFGGQTRYPYLLLDKITDKNRSILGTEEYIQDLCEKYDIVMPRAEDLGMTVREHYSKSAHHFENDLSLFLDILYKQRPEIKLFADKYLSQNKQYLCNIFIMKKEIFAEYCEILFPVLSEFDSCKKKHGNFQDDRTDGYLAERFTGMFVQYILDKGARIKEVTRVDINESLKKRIAFCLLPPESNRRFFAKKIIMFLRN